MATSPEFMEYVVEQIAGCGEIRYRKMFGEYLVYVNEKPVLLVCDNTVYVKMLDTIRSGRKWQKPNPQHLMRALRNIISWISTTAISAAGLYLCWSRLLPIPKRNAEKGSHEHTLLFALLFCASFVPTDIVDGCSRRPLHIPSPSAHEKGNPGGSSRTFSKAHFPASLSFPLCRIDHSQEYSETFPQMPTTSFVFPIRSLCRIGAEVHP